MWREYALRQQVLRRVRNEAWLRQAAPERHMIPRRIVQASRHVEESAEYVSTWIQSASHEESKRNFAPALSLSPKGKANIIDYLRSRDSEILG